MDMELPKHRRLYEVLRGEILENKYGGTGNFPSEAQLVRRSGYSRTTIRKALEELQHEGLVRSSQGRGTVVTDRGRVQTFGLILPGVSRYEYFQSVATELTRIAQENHSAFVFANVDTIDPNRLRQNVRDLAAEFIKRRIRGVIYHPVEFSAADDGANLQIVSAFRRARIPVVLIDCDVVMPPERSDFDVVTIANAHAAEQLTRHLLDAGARHVAVQMLPKTFPNMLDRVRGVANAVTSAGGKWSEQNVLVCEPTDVKAVRKLFSRSPRPDAVVCQNDAVAAELSQSLKRLGLNVPNDVMLAGFDGMDISRLMSPALTTIRQSHVELARRVFAVLQWRLEHPADPPITVLLPHKLVVRASSRRSPERKGKTK